MFSEFLLNLIVLLPILAAVALAFVPRDIDFLARPVALLTTLITMLAAFWVFFIGFETGLPGYQLITEIAWVESLGIQYRVGVDGVNIGLILMGAIVGFAAAGVSWDIKKREKEFYILMLLMIGGILGAFASLDLFFFYFFHELALVPTFIMIGVWGRGERKNYATFQITMYLSLGALIALAGLVALYAQMPAGARTFDIEKMTQYFAGSGNSVAADVQNWIFPLLMFGFGILVSLWPFHTWAPIGYGSAPTATAMLHAGVIKKFGLYGLIRVALPMVPEGAQQWLHVLALLCLGNILYCGLVAMRQKDLNMLIGNSSVAHMGFVFLGIASLSLVGITGAVVVMVAHGLLAALSFGISGYIFQQTGSLDMDKMGGFAHQLPFIGAVLTIAALAGCGLPGFANFVGEVMVFFAAWKTFPVITILAVWGALVIGAVYMLRAIRGILHGPRQEKYNEMEDASDCWRRTPFVLLIAVLLLFGFYPAFLTEKIKPSAEVIVSQAGGHIGEPADIEPTERAAGPGSQAPTD